MTVQEFYDFAKLHGLADAHIRICDGMAVSYYVVQNMIAKAPCELVIDVSSHEPLDYEDLSEFSKRVVYFQDL